MSTINNMGLDNNSVLNIGLLSCQLDLPFDHIVND